MFTDLFFLLAAGSGTSADTLSSMLYFICKYPKVKERLLKEFADHGIVKGCNVSEKITIENIQSMDYLANVMKETLRIDPTVISSIFYETYQDTEVCGVPIDKGTVIKVDITGPNNDENDWLDPRRFEPDRHDIDSEFFKKAKDAGKTTHAYSRRTFGHGPRSCMGMTFAQLEMKVLTIYFLITFDYQFPQEDLDNEGIGFGIGSPFNPEITLKSL